MQFPKPSKWRKYFIFLGNNDIQSSHKSVWPRVEKLADLGHNVTFLSAHHPKSLANPKVTEVVPKSLEKFYKSTFGEGGLLELRFAGGFENIWYKIPFMAAGAYELLAKDEDFLSWYNDTKFDLIFLDSLYSEFALGLAHKSDAQVAVFCTVAPYMWQNDAIGMPVESSWLPDMQWHYPEDNMNLFNRIMNTYRTIYWHWFRTGTYYPRVERIFREDLDLKDLPNFTELEKKVSLVLANTHFAEEYGRSFPPLVVPIGGLHCNLSSSQTPKDLEVFMNNTGSNGFFYVSFGSAADISKMPQERQELFFSAMRNSKTQFLLKWSGQVPETMPKNVFTISWVPQQNVLAHPNIKGFITHGGLLGIQEAVCAGVPLIVMPIFAEQDFNANRVHNRRRGIKLEMTTLTQTELEEAISNLLNDFSYRQNMQRTSKLFQDRPQKPLDSAVWWTEYILRNGVVDELKPLGIHQTWYQRRLIDVWFTIFALLVLPPVGLILLYWRYKFSKASKTSNLQKKED